ncbi:MAG: RNA methyltransferase [Armatimonadetes bacterium]|nr:RNA methyltransferase [Armatimonadota bacterium]
MPTLPRIDSAKEPRFKAAAALAQPLARARDGLFLIEGHRLVRQALAAGVLREAWLLDDLDDSALAADLLTAGIACHGIPASLGARLIGTAYDTRLGAVGVVARRPAPSLPTDGLILAAEALQDPRNVGVLVRTAEAAGLAALALSDDGADPWSRPAVRSTTGSILRQSVYLAADLPADLARLRREGMRVVATSARARQVVWEVDLTGPLVLLVGNESEGLSDAARDQADALVSLPMHGSASSLNVTVAAGALVYEALRQRAGIAPTRAPS